MKNLIAVSMLLTFAWTSAHAQTAYQTAIAAQNPQYNFHLDNTLVDSVGGTATFTATGGGFANDYYGSASSAAFFAATGDNLSLASPNIISGSGTTTGIGSLSLLFFVPAAAVPGTQYLFSGGETTGGAAAGQPASSAFALQYGTGTFTLKAGNKSITLPSPTLGSWNYFAATWNLSLSGAGSGINWYLGQAGGNTLNSGSLIKGGTGNISTTATIGDAGTFVLGNKQNLASPAGFNFGAGNPGVLDELSTWNSQLSGSQINDQFNSLIVPEPSTLALLGTGVMVLLGAHRKLRS
ncbi:MAG: hypothetical protein JWR19_4302 [Pedosphaera sp.]|nr:hypothetical protein [Pedosphaera sp.]